MSYDMLKKIEEYSNENQLNEIQIKQKNTYKMHALNKYRKTYILTTYAGIMPGSL